MLTVYQGISASCTRGLWHCTILNHFYIRYLGDFVNGLSNLQLQLTKGTMKKKCARACGQDLDAMFGWLHDKTHKVLLGSLQPHMHARTLSRLLPNAFMRSLSGKVRLHDLHLKAKAFEDMNFPVDITFGIIRMLFKKI